MGKLNVTAVKTCPKQIKYNRIICPFTTTHLCSWTVKINWILTVFLFAYLWKGISRRRTDDQEGVKWRILNHQIMLTIFFHSIVFFILSCFLFCCLLYAFLLFSSYLHFTLLLPCPSLSLSHSWQDLWLAALFLNHPYPLMQQQQPST